MKLKIEVSRENIDRGIQGDGQKCPIAKAIGVALKPYKNIRGENVGSDNIDFSHKKFDQEVTVATPSVASKFINKFDNIYWTPKEIKAERAKLKPFSFVVKLPNEWFQEKEKAKAKTKKTKSQKSKK